MRRLQLLGDDRIRLPVRVSAVFSDAKFAWLWLPVRVYLGYQWLSAGWEKLHSPAWVRTGSALAGFWGRAVFSPVGGDRGVVHYGWYHTFLQYALAHHWAPWFAKLIAGSETAVGVLLILGAFTGLIALGGAFLNFNYLLAGSASANPVLFTLEILLVLAWRVAGWVGLDFILLRSRRMPWAGLLHPSSAGTTAGALHTRSHAPRRARRFTPQVTAASAQHFGGTSPLPSLLSLRRRR